MSECSDITNAIQELSRKVDAYKRETETRLNQVNARMNALASLYQTLSNLTNRQEVRIIELEKKQSNRADSDLNLIKKQIKKISQDVLAIEKYINALDAADRQTNNILSRFVGMFNF